MLGKVKVVQKRKQVCVTFHPARKIYLWAVRDSQCGPGVRKAGCGIRTVRFAEKTLI